MDGGENSVSVRRRILRSMHATLAAVVVLLILAALGMLLLTTAPLWRAVTPTVEAVPGEEHVAG